jgi:membrane associated rhomboid family serine protease
VLNLIPISDANPTRRLPIITLSLIALNLAIYFLEPGQPSLMTPPQSEAYFVEHAPAPCDLQNTCRTHNVRLGPTAPVIHVPNRDLPGFLEAMLYSLFLHANILHVGGNMLFLWVFGNNVEDWLGRIKYLLFYLAGGFAAGFAQVFSNSHAIIGAVGASGAVASVLGAYFVLFPRARVNVLVPIFFFFTVIPMSAWLVLGLWFLFQIFVPQPGVAWQAHVGGFLFGLVMIFLLGGRPQRPRAVWPRYGWRS